MASTGDRPRPRLLVVEDSAAELDLVRDALEDLYEVEAVSRLGAGLERLARGGIDLVLLDLTLPDCEGWATFQRTREVAGETPVIVFTNHRDEELGARAVREGAQDYLVKAETDEGLLRRAVRYALERARAERDLKESEERYELAVRGANEGIWDWDLRSGRVYYSPRWRELLDLGSAEHVGSLDDWLNRVHPEDLEALRATIDAHLEGTLDHIEMEHRVRHGSGEYRWVLVRGLAVRDGEGRPYRVAGSLADITARKWAEQQLLHDAFHDGLTGLANRALFLDRIGLALARARREEETTFAVLVLDIERFKQVNEMFGPAAGDDLLVAAALRLERLVRPEDTVARLGNDEFGILLEGIGGTADAVRVAERVEAAFSRPFEVEGQRVYLNAAVGIVVGGEERSRADEVLRDAEIAMFRARAGESGRYAVFDPEMHESAVALLRMEHQLRQALENGEFLMHYQPIVSLESGRIVGFEGLVRWRHPERGLVAPQEFIAVAEESGIIVPLGWWVLDASCRQIRRWQEAFPTEPPLFVSVNVSARIFMEPKMVDRILELLERTGLRPESLRLEVTERVLLEHGEEALRRMTELKALGVKLSVDDFGTGYSSLSYLQRFAYDELKIDRSFVAALQRVGEGDAIVRAIVTLARMLGIGVVAEGVETAEQFHLLRNMRCPQGQGFWFARPAPPEDLEELLTRGPLW